MLKGSRLRVCTAGLVDHTLLDALLDGTLRHATLLDGLTLEGCGRQQQPDYLWRRTQPIGWWASAGHGPGTGTKGAPASRARQAPQCGWQTPRRAGPDPAACKMCVRACV